MNGPSPHLTWTELACKDGTLYPENFKKDGRVYKLAAMFEQIRLACGGKPLTVLSAYRTEAHNRKIGGARFSQHVQGRALDLRPPKGMTVTKFHQVIIGLAKSDLGKTIRGVGLYSTFVHIDIRPSLRLVTWSGTGKKDA